MLQINHLEKNYQDKVILNHISLTIEKPGLYGVVGVNGAGKTTFIKALCRSLGVGDRVSSPTFSLVNEYQAHEGKVFHFDLYRIEEEQEALDFGIEEYWDLGAWCFVEWAERIPSLLPLHYTEVQLTVIDETTRSLTVVQHN